MTAVREIVAKQQAAYNAREKAIPGQFTQHRLRDSDKQEKCQGESIKQQSELTAVLPAIHLPQPLAASGLQASACRLLNSNQLVTDKSSVN